MSFVAAAVVEVVVVLVLLLVLAVALFALVAPAAGRSHEQMSHCESCPALRYVHCGQDQSPRTEAAVEAAGLPRRVVVADGGDAAVTFGAAVDVVVVVVTRGRGDSHASQIVRA